VLGLAVILIMAFAFIGVRGTHWADQHQPFRRQTEFLDGLGISDPALVGETVNLQRSQLKAMKSIGVTSVRFDAAWDMVQPDGPTKFDWTELDQAVRSAHEAGMSIDLIIDRCPPWAAVPGTRGTESPVPASPTEYGAWAAEVAGRYASRGVRFFEIWNEPNVAGFWPPKANPSAYTADLVAAYTAIKARDRSALVISGGLAPAAADGKDMSPVNFLEAMYSDGAKGHFDAVGDHAYSYPALPNTYESWSGWSQMNRTKPSVRSIMEAHGDGVKRIWITEFGAPTRGPDGVGDAGETAEIGQALIDTSQDAWIGALYLYTWQDEGGEVDTNEDWFGLLTAAGTPKPAYDTVNNFEHR
jgi:hypothetical protein